MIDRMAELGMNKTKLAAKAGVTLSAIGQLLKPDGPPTTKVKPQIHRALGWDPPAPLEDAPAGDSSDVNKSIVDDGWHELSEENRAAVAAVVLALQKSKGK